MRLPEELEALEKAIMEGPQSYSWKAGLLAEIAGVYRRYYPGAEPGKTSGE